MPNQANGFSIWRPAPALTLARRLKGHANILGIDTADGMVRVAQAKVVKERLTGISFRCMPAEQLTLEDNTFDRVLCRFGVMLFTDPLQGRKCTVCSNRAAASPWRC